MRIGITLQLIKLLFGVNNGILEKQVIVGLEDRCRKKIKNKGKVRKKLILKP